MLSRQLSVLIILMLLGRPDAALGGDAAHINAQTFAPSPGVAGGTSVPSSEVLESRAVATSLWLDYGFRPFRISVPEEGLPEAYVVTQRLDAHVVLRGGVAQGVETGLELPLVLFQHGINTRYARQVVGFDGLDNGVLGDVVLMGRTWLPSVPEAWPSMSLGARLRLPTGNDGALAGEPGITLEPYAIASGQHRVHGASVSLGYCLRTAPLRIRGHNLVDDQVVYGVGYTYRIRDVGNWPGTTWSLELIGATAATRPFVDTFRAKAPAADSVEVRAGARPSFFSRLGPMSVSVAVGVGLLRGYGTPLARILLNIDHVTQNPLRDSDGDDRIDAADRCPNEPEDLDGFQDEDGCVDPDNDADGIPDEDDECPDAAGDPKVDFGGCPPPVVPDADGDYIPDAEDACPKQPEDRDGFEDWNGCPELDNDGDGLPDLNDICPLAAEDRNRFEDDDGCPDGGKAARLVSSSGRQVMLARRLVFSSDGKKILPESQRILDQLSSLLRKRHEGVQITVYPDRPTRLARRQAAARARAVVSALVARGVEDWRLRMVVGTWTRTTAGGLEIEMHHAW